MTRKTHKGRTVLEVVSNAPKTDTAVATAGPIVAPAMDTPIAPPAPKSVVKTAYKHRYQDQAKARGATDKASRRGNGDWLQRELQAETIGPKGIFDLNRFEAILDANGVDHSRWNRTTRGWEGRIRMSGSVALRGIVGKTGVLMLPQGNTISVQKLADEGDELAQAFLTKWSN